MAGGVESWTIGVVVAIVGSVPAAWVSYALGKKAAENEHDEDVDRRLRTAEQELAAVRAILAERAKQS